MLIHALMFMLGLVALIFGAELLVRGASRLALRVGISPLVVGLTVVAFGTSAPEMAVSVGAALDGKADLAVGNVVGSNICNVLLILGLCALITPLSVANQIIRQEVPIMIGASILLIVLAFDGLLSYADSALLFALIIAYTWFLIVQSRRATLATQEEGSSDMPAELSGWRNHWAAHVAYVVAGLVALVIGAGWLVDAAVALLQRGVQRREKRADSANEVGACLIGGQTKPFCGGFGGFLKGQGAPVGAGQRVAALPQERRGWGKRRQGKGHRVITSCKIYTGSA